MKTVRFQLAAGIHSKSVLKRGVCISPARVSCPGATLQASCRRGLYQGGFRFQGFGFCRFGLGLRVHCLRFGV